MAWNINTTCVADKQTKVQTPVVWMMTNVWSDLLSQPSVLLRRRQYSRFLVNVDKHVPDYTASSPRRP
jgi:hypothetical protein